MLSKRFEALFPTQPDSCQNPIINYFTWKPENLSLQWMSSNLLRFLKAVSRSSDQWISEWMILSNMGNINFSRFSDKIGHQILIAKFPKLSNMWSILDTWSVIKWHKISTSFEPDCRHCFSTLNMHSSKSFL